MSSEAIDYIKQPAVKFLKDSYSLVNKCTKPDRNGARADALRCAVGQKAGRGRSGCCCTPAQQTHPAPEGSTLAPWGLATR